VYIETIGPEAATGPVRELYDRDLASLGYITTDSILFSLRPAVQVAWRELVKELRKTITSAATSR
jgi:hypothetical protein